jgi:hypothetical protein
MKEGTCLNQKTVHSSPPRSILIQTPIPVKLPSLANKGYEYLTVAGSARPRRPNILLFRRRATTHIALFLLIALSVFSIKIQDSKFVS